MKTTIEDVFGFWDTIPEMADAVRVSSWTAHKWRQRGRIPPEYWDDLCSAAGRKGKKLSADDLLVMHGIRRRSGSAARAGA